MKWRVLFLSVFAALILQACSQIKLIYSWADAWAVSQLDSLIGLTIEQRKIAKKLIRQEIRNAVIQDYPRLRELSEEQIGLMEKPTAQFAEFNALMKKYEDYFLKIAPRLEKPLTEFAATLSPSQWNYLVDQLNRRVDRFAKRIRTDEDREAEKKKRIANWLRWNTSKISEAESAGAEAEYRKLDYPWDLELRNRRSFVTRVREKDIIQRLCRNPLLFRSPEYAAAYRVWIDKLRPVQWKLIQAQTAEGKKNWVVSRRDLLRQLHEIRESELTAK